MAGTCHRCAGSGWLFDQPVPCPACDGTGRPDGRLSPLQVMLRAELQRARDDRAALHRADIALGIGLASLAVAAAVAINVMLQGG